ncbi:hypothetical protein KDD17_03725 [Sulfitobacter albidus]|uniref:Uncharacterized protein n=1 Tax=Sulfitobacter albidus TaxID=2829501 RepID=A0A975PMT5_9RHOB|nr:hypothetical protein [Sulfitobacter albidus]QUJ77147.1 hypothetical protein KDD17_03725 [Sulfitobacter albidus]
MSQPDDPAFDADFGEADAAPTDVVADTLRDIEDALDEDDAAVPAHLAQDAEADAQQEEEAEEDIDALLSRLSDEEDDEENILIDDGTDDSEFSTFDEDEDDAEEEAEATLHADAAEDARQADEATDTDDAEDGNLFDREDTLAALPPEPEKPARRTRVLKVKRATLEAAISAGQLEEYEDEDDTAEVAPARRSSLSDDEEAELARELAELEADMQGRSAPVADDQEATADDTEVDEAPRADADTSDEGDTFDADEDEDDTAEHETVDENDAAADIAAQDTDGDDDDIDRLMDEADSQMHEPESATRRDAFAHLRAAVAAKKADEAVGAGDSDETRDDAYRDDLASVVRPRRPVASAQRTQRPPEQRPAPLKLVAEQRIDVDRATPSAPVRPRRVAAVVDNTTSDAPQAEGFVNFARDAGAEALPDLLEAAAAYIAYVEGNEQFSRPQLMTLVRQAEAESSSREDRLRHFGKLLRDGKIEKLSGGRFHATEAIGFKPDARAAG